MGDASWTQTREDTRPASRHFPFPGTGGSTPAGARACPPPSTTQPLPGRGTEDHQQPPGVSLSLSHHTHCAVREGFLGVVVIELGFIGWLIKWADFRGESMSSEETHERKRQRLDRVYLVGGEAHPLRAGRSVTRRAWDKVTPEPGFLCSQPSVHLSLSPSLHFYPLDCPGVKGPGPGTGSLLQRLLGGSQDDHPASPPQAQTTQRLQVLGAETRFCSRSFGSIWWSIYKMTTAGP